MSQLLLTLLQLGFLVLLWALVMAVIGVLRTDIYGTRLVTRGQATRRRNSGNASTSRQASSNHPASSSQAPTAPTAAVGAGAAGSGRGWAPRRREAAADRGRVRAGKLVVTEGPLRGTTITLADSAVVIGRAADSTLVLDDDFASARHARLTPGPEGWVVEDLGSTNGTRVNGQPLDHPAMATEGTAIQIGKTVLELRR